MEKAGGGGGGGVETQMEGGVETQKSNKKEVGFDLDINLLPLNCNQKMKELSIKN